MRTPRMTIFEGLDLYRVPLSDSLFLMRGALVAYETHFYELMQSPRPLTKETVRMVLVDYQHFEEACWKFLYRVAIHHFREDIFPFDVLNASLLAAQEFARQNNSPYPISHGFYRAKNAYKYEVDLWRTSARCDANSRRYIPRLLPSASRP